VTTNGNRVIHSLCPNLLVGLSADPGDRYCGIDDLKCCLSIFKFSHVAYVATLVLLIRCATRLKTATEEMKRTRSVDIIVSDGQHFSFSA
jgi:hypothetical protein